MNVLSLFDGMSCGQVALNRAGIKIDNYFASEIDSAAIKVTQHNFPNTIQLGSVTDIDTNKLPRIDILIGGSPCQSFSFAGKRQGMVTKEMLEITKLEQYLELKENGFEFEGQSYLFWEYMRIFKEINPKYFLLENVKMSKKWKGILTNAIGYEPILINSALVSAQNRQRLYWTNIPNIKQPEDKGILLKDILENDMDSLIEHIVSEKRKNLILKGNYTSSVLNDINGKSQCLMTGFGEGGGKPFLVCPVLSKTGNVFITLNTFLKTISHGYIEESIKQIDKYPNLCAQDPSSKHKIVEIPFMFTECRTDQAKENRKKIRKETGKDYCDRRDKELVPRNDSKSNCLTTSLSNEHFLIDNNLKFRKLTPLECERLQTLPDNYSAIVSNNQRYKMIGNGWTVDVIAHILKNIKSSENVVFTSKIVNLDDTFDF